MANITIVDIEGVAHNIEAEDGLSVMEVAYDNQIAGIVAECGGASACGTCHVYVDEAWVSKLPEPDEMEDTMLDVVNDRKSNSRLSCQLSVGSELDGLLVNVADNEM